MRRVIEKSPTVYIIDYWLCSVVRNVGNKGDSDKPNRNEEDVIDHLGKDSYCSEVAKNLVDFYLHSSNF